MKRYLRCLIILTCIVFLSGCINKSEISKNESNMSSQSSRGDYDIPSLFYGVISIHDLNDNIVDTPIIKYEGQRMSYKLFTNIVQSKENGPEYFNRTFFILVNGKLQPFYFEDSKEEVLYVQLDGDSNRDLSYKFSFDPIYVPYGENTVISFVISNSPKYIPQNNTEQILSSSLEQNYCLTASLEKYSIDNNEGKNGEDEIVEKLYNDLQTPGILLTEKMDDINQFKLNNMFENQKQLYAALSLPIDTDIRVLAVIDGKISDVFDGRNSIDLHVEPGNIYEIPLRLKNLKEEETHQISFVMINMDEMNAIKTCSTGNQIMSHTITSMQYTYYINVKK